VLQLSVVQALLSSQVTVLVVWHCPLSALQDSVVQLLLSLHGGQSGIDPDCAPEDASPLSQAPSLWLAL